jgi:hypothetical protein
VSLLSPYRAVLRTPYARGAFVSSLVGRLCYGVVGLSLLLTLTAGGRDYGFAGLVMALFGLTIVLVSRSAPGWSTGTGRAGRCRRWRPASPPCWWPSR